MARQHTGYTHGDSPLLAGGGYGHHALAQQIFRNNPNSNLEIRGSYKLQLDSAARLSIPIHLPKSSSPKSTSPQVGVPGVACASLLVAGITRFLSTDDAFMMFIFCHQPHDTLVLLQSFVPNINISWSGCASSGGACSAGSPGIVRLMNLEMIFGYACCGASKHYQMTENGHHRHQGIRSTRGISYA